MLKSILNFIRRERFWLLALILLGTLYFFIDHLSVVETRPQTSKEMTAFQQAEKKVQAQSQNPESLERALEKRPVFKKVFYSFTTLVAMLFAAGCLLDFALVLNVPFRQKFFARQAHPEHSWGIGQLLHVSVLWIAAGLAMSFLAGYAEVFLEREVSFNLYAVIHTTILDVLCFVFIVRVIAPEGNHWRDLGFKLSGKEALREMFTGAGFYAAVIPVFFLVLILIITIANLLSYEPEPHPLVGIFLEEEKRSPVIVYYTVFLASIIGPIFEEIFFRGFCYSIFRNKWGVKWAMILSSALFALIHRNEFAFLPIFLLGLGLAFLYERRGNLIAPMTLHVFHNVLFLTYFFIAKEIVMMQSG